MSAPDLQPTLQSELLQLRPLLIEDFEELYTAASDPAIWEQHPFSDRYKKDIFEKFFEEALASKGAFAIIDPKNNQIIGSSRFYEVDLDKKEIVIGYTFLKRDYWGGLYNRDLKTLMLRHAFNFFDSVLFHVDEFNLRSQKAMEKIGGIRAGQFYKTKNDGGQRTAYIYRIDRRNWKS